MRALFSFFLCFVVHAFLPEKMFLTWFTLQRAYRRQFRKDGGRNSGPPPSSLPFPSLLLLWLIPSNHFFPAFQLFAFSLFSPLLPFRALFFPSDIVFFLLLNFPFSHLFPSFCLPCLPVRLPSVSLIFLCHLMPYTPSETEVLVFRLCIKLSLAPREARPPRSEKGEGREAKGRGGEWLGERRALAVTRSMPFQPWQ